MRNSLRLLLIVSLVLNLFLLSAGAALVWRWAHGFGAGGWRGRAVEVLAPEHRRPFRQAMRQTVLGSRDLLAEGRNARADAAAHFVEPAFDAAKIKADLARARAADVALRGRIEERVVDFAGNLPVEERARLAEVLKRGPFRQPRGQQKNANASDGNPPQPR